ncbi:unnamed protein product [Euphydryas editha]|uniref:Uncharacterized protein n=1 Tax=Euphydryas editha TaxID=104508 RepID=A0AAU9TK50_EUPED|nr:unnamed protein product [Euphydryas editha]
MHKQVAGNPSAKNRTEKVSGEAYTESSAESILKPEKNTKLKPEMHKQVAGNPSAKNRTEKVSGEAYTESSAGLPGGKWIHRLSMAENNSTPKSRPDFWLRPSTRRG